METFDLNTEDYGMDFFQALANRLEAHKRSAKVEKEIGDWMPKIRTAHCAQQGPGWYFRKDDMEPMSVREKKLWKDCFPFIYNGLAVDLGSIDDPESDGDRDYPASVTFHPIDPVLAAEIIVQRHASMSWLNYHMLVNSISPN